MRPKPVLAALAFILAAAVSVVLLQPAGARDAPAIASQPSPYVAAALGEAGLISGQGFTVGEPISIEVDDPATPDVTPDWTYTVFMEPCPGGPAGCFSFEIWDVPVEPGYLITASDSMIVKQHEVVDFGPTVIDEANATLGGTAPLGTQVTVWAESYSVNGQGAPIRAVTADQACVDGTCTYIADFGVPGSGGGPDDEFTIDSFKWGDQFTVRAFDDDGDMTQKNASFGSLGSPGPTPSPTPTPAPTPYVWLRLWGDADCNNAITPVDSLKLLRADAGLSVAYETQQCPKIGGTAVASVDVPTWGDADCSGEVNPVDSLKTLRYDAGLIVHQAAGCPAMGSDDW